MEILRYSEETKYSGKIKIINYKKVLLREHKRHTTRRVASTPYVVLTGYLPNPDLAGGVPTWVPPSPCQGTPLAGYPLQGYPPAVYPPTRVPPHQGTPQLDLAGYPPTRVPPGWTWQGTSPTSCPMAFWVMLQSIMGYGYPPLWTDRQTRVKTLPSHRTTYAGGKNVLNVHLDLLQTQMAKDVKSQMRGIGQDIMQLTEGKYNITSCQIRSNSHS